MTEFVWSDQLKIGVGPMDREHQQIITLMNVLAVAHESGASFLELDRAFTDLARYTTKHFKDEEAFMESIDFEGLRSHKVIHERLLKEMGEHYEEFRKNRELDPKVFRFLTFWLKSHICGIDKKYAEAAKGVRAA